MSRAGLRIVFILFLATVCLGVFIPLASAQEDPSIERSRIVVAVLQSGEVPPGIVRDIQDLFLTALAERAEYELVDRQAVFEVTSVKSDVDLLLCVSQPSCVRDLYEEFRYEQFVLVKVAEAKKRIRFSAVTFNYTNDTPIEFANEIEVPVGDIDLLIDKAFAAAEGIDLVLVREQRVDKVGSCGGAICTTEEHCLDEVCVSDRAIEVPVPVPEEGPAWYSEIDWVFVSGYALAGVGVVSGVVSVVSYMDASGKAGEYAESYDRHGVSAISDDTRVDAFAAADDINSAAGLYEVTLMVSMVTLSAGAGLLAWHYFMDPTFAEQENLESENSVVDGVAIVPFLSPDGALGIGAAMRF